jgi:hypothetical protein
MSCQCGGPSADWNTWGICEVCALLDRNTSYKWVRYCSFCQAWMCQYCWNHPIRRAQAAALRAVQRWWRR